MEMEIVADAQSTLSPGIQAVVFDAVGTVMYPRPSVADAYRTAIYQYCGHEIAADVVQIAVKEGLRLRSAGQDLSTNEEAEREFWADLIRKLCPTPNGFQPCFDALFDHFGRAESWRCFPDVAGLMQNLTQLGLTVAIASNFDNRLNAVCEGLEELAGVSCRIISSQVGFRKPAAEFFSGVVDTLGIPAERILLVGDDLINDVQGAVDAGFQSAWICRSSSGFQKVPPGVLRLTDLRELPEIVKIANSNPANPNEQSRTA